MSYAWADDAWASGSLADGSWGGAALTVPDAPTAVVGTAGNHQISVAGTPPLNDGGAAIIGYQADDGTGAHLTATGAMPRVVTSLTNGSPYTVRLRAVNSVGAGAWGTAALAVTPVAAAVSVVVNVAATGSVDIANSALTRLGAKRIMSLDDTQKEAREVNAIFNIRRDALLRAYAWNFSLKRALLSPLTDAPGWGYPYAYQLPTDCLRVVQVNDCYNIPGLADYIAGTDIDEFRIEGRTIATHYGAPLKVRYIRRVTNPAEFDVLFAEVLACDLAYNLCEALTQSNTKKESAKGDKKQALLEAVRANAIELPPQILQDDSWIISRL